MNQVCKFQDTRISIDTSFISIKKKKTTGLIQKYYKILVCLNVQLTHMPPSFFFLSTTYMVHIEMYCSLTIRVEENNFLTVRINTKVKKIQEL